MAFLDFCRKLASDEPLFIHNVDYDDSTLPPSLNALVNIMKPKMGRLDRLSVSFIESRFEDMNEVINTLDEKHGGEIPDEIIAALVDKLYDGRQTLNNDEQAIIKTLATYLMLQY